VQVANGNYVTLTGGDSIRGLSYGAALARAVAKKLPAISTGVIEDTYNNTTLLGQSDKLPQKQKKLGARLIAYHDFDIVSP